MAFHDGIVFLLVMAITVASASAGAPVRTSLKQLNGVGGYLFVTFRGEQNLLTEQIYFALSRDGFNWTALNGGAPILVNHMCCEYGVRDPFLLRSQDNKTFYLLATDLNMNRYGANNWWRAMYSGSRAIIIWESVDLVRWSSPRRVEVAPLGAGCTWAPEAVYDAAAGDYLVFWASTGPWNRKLSIWASRTKDFKTFSKPFVYIDWPFSVIDATIVQENGRYYRFSKDENVKSILMETSTSLYGPWQPVRGFTTVFGHEGPLAFQLTPPSGGQPGTWMLLLDFYSRGWGYQAFVTRNISSGQFSFVGNQMKFPYPFRHGNVLRVTEEEFGRLSSAYGNSPYLAGFNP